MPDYMHQKFKDNQIIIDEINRAANESGESFDSFIKTFLAILSGMVSVLVSLKKETPQPLPHYLFTITIGLLSLCILSGGLLLFQKTVALGRFQGNLQEELYKRVFEGKEGFEVFFPEKSKFYKVSLWTGIISFSLSLICLTMYSFLI